MTKINQSDGFNQNKVYKPKNVNNITEYIYVQLYTILQQIQQNI